MLRKECDVFIWFFPRVKKGKVASKMLSFSPGAESHSATTDVFQACCIHIPFDLIVLYDGKMRLREGTIWLHVRWRNEVTVQRENQEVRHEQRDHWMNPALRELMFICPLSAHILIHHYTYKHSQGYDKTCQKPPNSLKADTLKLVPSSHNDGNMPLVVNK